MFYFFSSPKLNMNYNLNARHQASSTAAQQEYQNILSCTYRSEVVPLVKVSFIRKAMHIAESYPLDGEPAGVANNNGIVSLAHNISQQSTFLPPKDIMPLFEQMCQPSSISISRQESEVIFKESLKKMLLKKASVLWEEYLASLNMLHMLKINTHSTCLQIGPSSVESKLAALEKYPSIKLKRVESKLVSPQSPVVSTNETKPNLTPWIPQKTQPKVDVPNSTSGFLSAQEQLKIDIANGRVPPNACRGLRKPPPPQPTVNNVISATHKGAGVKRDDKKDDDDDPFPESLLLPDGSIPSQLEGLEPKLLSQVAMEILDSKGTGTDWSDIAGLEHAKSSVEEAIVWPLMNPDLFTGLRDPPRGLLLFGPPGTGKTMIARAIASRAGCTFMNISASSLMSKWVGEGEKLVRCMFAVACVKQPTVVFIDEIDSLLSARSEGEMEVTRRVKTEFLVQMDGVGTDRSDRILLIGATNRPEELDEAARRRMEKRLYIPLPDLQSRTELFRRLISTHAHELTPEDFNSIGVDTEGYSGADIKGLAREAAMGPVRDVRTRAGMMSGKEISTLSAKDVRPVSFKDCRAALRRIKPSVGSAELVRYESWNDKFGSFPLQLEKDFHEED